MAKKIFSKRTLAVLLSLVMVFNLTGIGALAAQPQGFSLVQNFQDTYYKQDGTAGSVDDWQIHLSKTAAPTAQDNVYDITLQVRTKNTTTEIAGSTHGAAVLVLDISNSMDTGEGKTGKTRMDNLKSAVGSFLDSYAANAGIGEKRMVSVVVFGTGAKTVQHWIDVADDNARATVKGIVNSLSTGNGAYLGKTKLFEGGTNMEGGLVLGRNLLKQDTVASIPVENQSLILFSDGDPTVSVSDANSAATDSIGYGGSDIGYQTDWADYDNVRAILSGVAGAKIAVAYNYSDSKGILSAPPFTRVIRSSSGSLSVDLQGEAGKVITVVTNASTITDPMGQGVSMVSVSTGYDQAAQKWNLSQYTPAVSDGITTYTITYQVQIDPEAVAADPAYPAYTVLTPANGATTLDYTYGENHAIVHADFNEPNIRGVRRFNVSYAYTGVIPQGAPQVPGAETYKAGQSVAVAPEPTLENYTFSGWDKTDFTMPAEDVVIQGSWIENAKYDYAVIYNENYGAAPATKADAENITGTYAESHAIGVDTNEFTRPNYTFIGWAETPEGEVVYQAGDSIIFSHGGSKTLYAKWIEHDKYSYTVIYNGNGGARATGELAYGDSENVSETYEKTHSVTVDGNSFLLENHTFIGWNTQADGKGISYTVNDVIALNTRENTCTLYAQWKENDKHAYELIYNANYGAAPRTAADEENISDTYATLYPITVNDSMFARANYTFVGWNTQADGSGVAYAAGEKISLNARVNSAVLYAQWQENPKYDYALTYNANFGADPAISSDNENISGIYAASHSIGVDNNRFVRENHTFIGWNTQADGSGKEYKAGDVIGLTAENNTAVLYAQWQENPKYSYTVQYNENYGAHPVVYRDSESVSDIYAAGYTIGVDENTFTRPNYTFVGWNTQADGSGKEYKAGETIALTAENNYAILYAQWQENPKYDYAVIYHSNFGADLSAPDSQNISGTYANPYAIGVDRNTFTRPNYTFIGWAETPDGQVVYQAGDSILFTQSGSKTLYAKWIEHNKYSFTLIYNGNGGILADGHDAYGDSENAEGIYDNHLEITVDWNTFVREGYTFTGWNTDPDGSGIACDPENLVALTALHNTMTLYAQWQENPKYDYSVIYNANYGEEPATRADDQNVAGVTSDALNFSVDAEEFAREGYTFTGWNTDPDGSGKAYKAGDIIALTAEDNTEILYAQWEINAYAYTVQYVVRVDANPYAAFQGQLPESAPLGGEAVYGEVIDGTTLQLPKTLTDGTHIYSYTGIDGIVIPYGANTVIVYYSAVTVTEEIPEEEIPVVQNPTNEPAPVNPTNEPAPATPTTPVTPGAPLVELPDEEVPLADAPKTGDAMILYMGMTALSGMGLLGLGLTKKKEENEEN